jgi:hypothetical protein
MAVIARKVCVPAMLVIPTPAKNQPTTAKVVSVVRSLTIEGLLMFVQVVGVLRIIDVLNRRIHTPTHTHTQTHTHTHPYISKFTNTCLHPPRHAQPSTHLVNTHSYPHAHMHTHTGTHTHTRTHAHTHTPNLELKPVFFTTGATCGRSNRWASACLSVCLSVCLSFSLSIFLVC